jgi:hypothetical protein
MMRVVGRHPRHPEVQVYKCDNLYCGLTIYYDMHRETLVRKELL